MTEEQPQPAPPRPKRKPLGMVVRLLIAGCLLGTVMGGVLALVIGVHKSPSTSMWPTLNAGEYLAAARIAKQPFRGALIVFRSPEHRASLFAKRIVALEGDVVSVTDGALAINGWSVPRCAVGRASYADEGAAGGGKHEGTLYVEWLGEASYLVFDEKLALGSPGEGKSWTVGKGEVFMVGDNRNNSHDSRVWLEGKGGGVPAADIVGRVLFHESATLPRGAEELGPALATCLAKRPLQTDPPPSR